jgi:hypothetical protein
MFKFRPGVWYTLTIPATQEAKVGGLQSEPAQAYAQDYVKKKLKQKGLRVWLKGWSPELKPQYRCVCGSD